MSPFKLNKLVAFALSALLGALLLNLFTQDRLAVEKKRTWELIKRDELSRALRN